MQNLKIGDVCYLQNGFAFKSKLFKDSGKPILRISNIQNEKIDVRRPVFFEPSDYKGIDFKKYEVKKGDLLIAMSGATTGKIGFNYSETTFYLNQRVGKLIPNEYLDKKYLFYILSTKVEENLNISKGAAQPNLSSEQIKNIKIQLPTIIEQQQIVAKIENFFFKIDKQIELTKINTVNINTLLDNFLVDLYNQDCFEELKINDICKIIGGSQPPKSLFQKEKNENNVRLLQIRDYKNDNHIIYIPKKSTKKFCNEKDIMIGRYGPPLFQILRGLKGAYNVALMKAIPKLEKIKNDYLFYFLKNKKIQNYIISLSHRAAGQTGVNKVTLMSYPIKLPPLNTQNKIVEKTTKIQNYCEKISYLELKKQKNLNLLKKSLLKTYLNSKST